MQSNVSEKFIASIIRIEGTAASILCPEQFCPKRWNLRTRAHGVITQQRCMQMLSVPLHLQFHWPSPCQQPTSRRLHYNIDLLPCPSVFLPATNFRLFCVSRTFIQLYYDPVSTVEAAKRVTSRAAPIPADKVL